ncbi:MAG: hypothetical protein H0U57_04400 [Tatlockia sp.]|nr:hypothetical protein [Tatlockia sp.]
MTKDKQTPTAFEKSQPSKLQKYDQVELLSDKAHEGDLVLRVNGKKVIISEADLTKILQPNLFKPGKNSVVDNKEINSQFLGQYGLKSARDVISFLKSPAGEKTKKLLSDLLVLLVALKELKAEQIMRESLLRQLLMTQIRLVQIRLHKIAKKEARSKLNAAYQQQIDKSLAYGAAMAAQQSSSSTSVNPDYYDNVLRDHIIASYSLATRAIENDLQETLEEAQLLESEINLHEAESAKILERYAILATHLQTLDEHADFLTTFENHSKRIEVTDAALSAIREQLRQFSETIQQHVENGEDLKAEQLLNHLDGLNVQAEGMNSILSVLNLQKKYYDAEGSTTDSFKKAAFVVDNQQQLFKDKVSGKLYLLSPGQNFDNMTADEKAKAQESYEASKPEIALIKTKINQYKATELGLFEEKKQSLITRSATLQKDILDLTNQLNQAKAAEAGALALILEPKMDLSKVPTPKPTMKSNQPQLKPQFSQTQSYRQILQLMRFNPTVEAINQFKNGLLHSNGQPNKAAQDIFSNTVKPNQKIEVSKMNHLLANLERLGISVNKPGINPIPSAHPQKHDKEHRASNSPTPFKTTPSPFKF